MGTKRKGGRPSKLTPELQERIIECIRRGAFIERACQLVGVGERTYHGWIERGEKDAAAGRDTPFSQFMQAATQARAQVQQVCIEYLLNNKDPEKLNENMKWFLERSFFAEYGRKSFSMSSKIAAPEEEEEPDRAPSLAAQKAVLLQLVEDHPEIREELQSLPP